MGARPATRDEYWLGLLPPPASEAQPGEGWGEGLFAITPLTHFSDHGNTIVPSPRKRGEGTCRGSGCRSLKRR